MNVLSQYSVGHNVNSHTARAMSLEEGLSSMSADVQNNTGPTLKLEPVDSSYQGRHGIMALWASNKFHEALSEIEVLAAQRSKPTFNGDSESEKPREKKHRKSEVPDPNQPYQCNPRKSLRN